MKVLLTQKKSLLSTLLKYKLHYGGFKQPYWNPESKAFLSLFRKTFCFIDVNLTYYYLKKAMSFLNFIIHNKLKILFIGKPFGLEKEFIFFCKKYKMGHMDNKLFKTFSSKVFLLHLSKLKKKPVLLFFFSFDHADKSLLKRLNHLNYPTMAFLNSTNSLEGIDYPIPGGLTSWKSSLFFFNLLKSFFLRYRPRPSKQKKLSPRSKTSSKNIQYSVK